MEKLDVALCQWIVPYSLYLNFQFFLYSWILQTKYITWKQSLAENLKLFKFSLINRQWIFYFGHT